MTTTVDLSRIRSPEIKALALLAEALNWNVRFTSTGGLMLDHPFSNGVSLPTDQGSLREGAFRTKTRHIARFPPDEKWADSNNGWLLADSIADTAKLKRDKRRAFIDSVVAELGGHKPEPVKQPDPTPAPPAIEAQSQAAEEQNVISSTPQRENEMPTIESTRPAQRVRLTKPSKNYVEYEDSQSVIERTWSDGTIDFECADPDCDRSGPSMRSIAMHYGRVHSRKNHPETDAIVNGNEPEPRFPDAVKKLNEIAKIIGLGQEVHELRERNTALQAENDELRGSLKALRDLLAGIGGDDD